MQHALNGSRGWFIPSKERSKLAHSVYGNRVAEPQVVRWIQMPAWEEHIGEPGGVEVVPVVAAGTELLADWYYRVQRFLGCLRALAVKATRCAAQLAWPAPRDALELAVLLATWRIWRVGELACVERTAELALEQRLLFPVHAAAHHGRQAAQVLFILCSRLRAGGVRSLDPPTGQGPVAHLWNQLLSTFRWIAYPHAPVLVALSTRPGVLVAAELEPSQQLCLLTFECAEPLAALTRRLVWSTLASTTHSLENVRSEHRWLLPLPAPISSRADAGAIRVLAPISFIIRCMLGPRELLRVGWMVHPVIRNRLMHALNGHGSHAEAGPQCSRVDSCHYSSGGTSVWCRPLPHMSRKLPN